jgi:hypothetical protein
MLGSSGRTMIDELVAQIVSMSVGGGSSSYDPPSGRAKYVVAFARGEATTTSAVCGSRVASKTIASVAATAATAHIADNDISTANRTIERGFVPGIRFS